VPRLKEKKNQKKKIKKRKYWIRPPSADRVQTASLTEDRLWRKKAKEKRSKKENKKIVPTLPYLTDTHATLHK
jgi:hypothetical protein